jgi:hypothetical protein
MTMMGNGKRALALSTVLMTFLAAACGGGSSGPDDRREPSVLSAVGTAVPSMVEEFRTQLGRDNGGNPERGFTGRREVNWDSVPDEASAPGFLPPDFFNARTEPLARGIRLTTPGDGVQVSADASNPSNTPVRFGHINPTYPNTFSTFSEERLFSPVGSNIVDVTFSIPGAPEVQALTNAFGAVYTDVDTTGGSSFTFFAEDDVVLGEYFVPANPGGLSFLGVIYEAPVVKRVRIAYGSRALGPTDDPDDGDDVAVMDDFIFGEPQPQD